MQELENLLTSLIQRGRKPWGLGYFAEVMVFKTYIDFITKKWASSPTSLRELVSLESGLWQFCMGQKLCRDLKQNRLMYSVQMFEAGPDYWSNNDYRYRLLESALLPEEELGQFLVDNIVIEWKKE